MKLKFLICLICLFLCICISACGEEVLHPLDCPGSSWTCEEYDLGFSVSSDGSVCKGTILTDSGKRLNVLFNFSPEDRNTFSVVNADNGDVCFKGDCEITKNGLAIYIIEEYGLECGNLPTRIVFTKK